MVYFRNLIVNQSSEKYSPLLLNLVSLRRRILKADELILIESMIRKKESIDLFSYEEKILHTALVDEKQILSEDIIKQVDDMMLENYIENRRNISDRTDIAITIQLTEECNMSCKYCFEDKYLSNKQGLRHMTNDHIDKIACYFEQAKVELGVEYNVKLIKLTGGEPLYDMRCVELINYISTKWPHAKLVLQTNGVNLVKYYGQLPLSNITQALISLDGMEKTHIERRFKNAANVDSSLYQNIIDGIKMLIRDGILVRLVSTFDRTSYSDYPAFIAYLKEEGILARNAADIVAGVVLDYTNGYCIDEAFNNKQDMLTMRSYFADTMEGDNPGLGMYPSMWKLKAALSRTGEAPLSPSTGVCGGRYFGNQYFSPNGYVYMCTRISSDNGIVGTYFPNTKVYVDKHERIIHYNPIFHEEKCKACIYKYVCYGGCPMITENQGETALCGPFSDSDIMDNIEFNIDAVCGSVPAV